MKKLNVVPRKLTLTKESLRVLKPDHLTTVAGGFTTLLTVVPISASVASVTWTIAPASEKTECRLTDAVDTHQSACCKL